MAEQKIILASSSAQRKILMENLNVPFEVYPADIDEKAIRDEDLKVRAEKIARAKAEKVISERGGIIIAADMFLDFNGQVMEKPKDIDEAKQMLQGLSGHKFNSYTGFCYIDKQNNIDFSTAVVTNSALRTLSEAEIDQYVRKFPVTTWAGAFSA
ncbi:Maf family protein, partial [Patescibacteria group bacterium]|nr:Maf family protein [Patescibacteria group bacterium]